MTENDPYDDRPEVSRVDNACNAKVQRVIWEDGPYIYKTEWMDNHEFVRDLYEQKCEEMPGANVRFQLADVETVTNIRDKDFSGR